MNESDEKRQNRIDAEALVKHYQSTGDVAARNDAILRYKYLVLKCAAAHKAKAHVDVEELQSYGFDGMFAALRLWKPESNVSFGYFAKFKIKCAIKDGLRSMDKATRTQRERGEAPVFGTLSAVGNEGAREHQDFSDFEIRDEFESAVGRAVLSDWTERVIFVLTFREGWSSDWIAESLDVPESEVKRIVRAVTARLGDGAIEVAPKVASLKYRAKVALAAAEREMRDVLLDVAKFEKAKMRKTVVKLLESLWQRRASENYSWSGDFVGRVVKAAAVWRVALLPIYT